MYTFAIVDLKSKVYTFISDHPLIHYTYTFIYCLLPSFTSKNAIFQEIVRPRSSSLNSAQPISTSTNFHAADVRRQSCFSLHTGKVKIEKNRKISKKWIKMDNYQVSQKKCPFRRGLPFSKRDIFSGTPCRKEPRVYASWVIIFSYRSSRRKVAILINI